ncbi:MAG: hypothetical protein GF332_03400 [Candidatus Moranbacteria bacterium]|nr:hypothetical protein [Candidatus Moranbacteria bacterium]
MVKKLFSILAISLLAVGIYGLNAPPAQAEIEMSDNVRIISTVNIDQARIISRKNNIFRVSFTVSNQEKIQPNIRYAISLAKKGDLYDFIDSYTYPGSMDLIENSSITKQVTFTAPGYLQGQYDMYLELANKEGLTLGRIKIDTIQLNGSGDYIEINPRSCRLKVSGSDQSYDLMQGVDVKKEEKLYIECSAQNHGNISLDLTADFQTTYRSRFGNKQVTQNVVQNTQTIGPEETKALAFEVPKALVPQSYQAKMNLKQNDRKISNTIILQYVISGASATINNFRVDTDYFLKGDTFVGYLNWTPSADFFPDSRHGGTEIQGMQARLTVQNQDGQDCIERKIQKIDQDNIEEVKITAPIIQDCVNPRAKVEIIDHKAKILAARDFEFKSVQKTRPTAPEQKKEKKTAGNLNLIIFGVLTLVLIILLLIFLMKNKNINFSGKVLLLFATCLGLTCFSTIPAKAETFQINIDGHQYSATVNEEPILSTQAENPTTLDIGSRITISSSPMALDVCGNVKPTAARFRVLHDEEIVLPESGSGWGDLGDTVSFNSNGPCDQVHEVRYEIEVDYMYIRGRSYGETGMVGNIIKTMYYKPDCDPEFQCMVNISDLEVTHSDPKALCGDFGLPGKYKVISPGSSQYPDKDAFCGTNGVFVKGMTASNSFQEYASNHNESVSNASVFEDYFKEAIDGGFTGDDAILMWNCEATASGQQDLVTCGARVFDPAAPPESPSIASATPGECVEIDADSSWPEEPQNNEDFCSPRGSKVVKKTGTGYTFVDTTQPLVEAPDSGEKATWYCSEVAATQGTLEDDTVTSCEYDNTGDGNIYE